MRYKQGISRYQTFFTSLDSLIPQDSIARVIDAFVDSIDISDFKYSSPSAFGNKPIDPRTLLKIYILGYKSKIRSSRKIEFALTNNLDFIWISNSLKIKHSAIADFRKDNHELFKNVLIAFNLDCKNLNLISSFSSIDGTKIKAVNSKDNNFTLNKIDDRIKHAIDDVNEYDKLFDSNDTTDEEREVILRKAVDCDKKLKRYQSLLNHMQQNNLSQISLTDPDSKLMRNNGKFEVCYNNQVSVDMHSHLVTDFNLSSNPADVDSLAPLNKEVKDIYDIDILTSTTDKGYNSSSDMIACLEQGIIPEVTPNKGKEGFTLETDYEDNIISDEMKKSTDKDDIKKCLRAGVIPDVYQENIKSIEIVEKNYYENTNQVVDNELTDDDRRNMAMANNCFVRNKEDEKVFCPQGNILRKKSTNKGRIRFCNKLACKNCKNPCHNSKDGFKTADFKPDQTILGKSKSSTNCKKKRIKKKKVIIKTKSNFELLKKRMATSEHPHASMKFWDDSHYLLTKGIKKATGEVALYYCAYNIRCAVNKLGIKEIIQYFEEKKSLNSKKIPSIFSIFLIFFKKSKNLIFLDFIMLYFLYSRTISPPRLSVKYQFT